MKKLLSLVFGLALMVAFTTTSEASIKFSGDAQVRARGQFQETKVNGTVTSNDEELYWLYRLRLKVAADLGGGYFAKALLASETPGWFAAVGGRGAFPNNLADSFGANQMYFGRMMPNSHYMVGIMPVNSFNNPIFDLATRPSQPLGIPYFLENNDRIFGLNYGRKAGPGELSATLCVVDDLLLDNNTFFRDEYAIHLMYRTNIGDVTIDPQLLAAITEGFLPSMGYTDVAPWTFGTNVIIPAGKTKISLSGFYTFAGLDSGNTDYDAYLLRVKAEHGPVRAWVDYSAMDDESVGVDDSYKNFYVWAQYNWKVYQSSMGSFTLSPTVRFLNTDKNDGALEFQRLRTELWAQVTF